MSWESIRNLTLRSCNLSYYESIANILSGCPILETLELIYCRNLPQRLNLSKSLSLRRLEIKWSFKSSYPVEIVAPHIHYLKLTMYEESCTLVDVSSVTQASLEIFFNNNFFWVAEFVQIMVLIKDARKVAKHREAYFRENPSSDAISGRALWSSFPNA
uniref:F-box/LRR-repeat protein 15/At3g58940/PEG3-like LRR domain-containing protein n=1 Tax=Brassica oleracea TaxID=3712 RepID=A0A3P6CI40_BRAOL|nr:unnamed protein product [Brassica oleracea]